MVAQCDTVGLNQPPERGDINVPIDCDPLGHVLSFYKMLYAFLPDENTIYYFDAIIVSGMIYVMNVMMHGQLI